MKDTSLAVLRPRPASPGSRARSSPSRAGSPLAVRGRRSAPSRWRAFRVPVEPDLEFDQRCQCDPASPVAVPPIHPDRSREAAASPHCLYHRQASA